MDIDPPVPPTSAPRKPKFTPKAPRRRITDPVLPKSNNSDDETRSTRPYFLRKFSNRHGTRGSEVEKKSSGNVTLSSHGAGSSSTQLSTEGQPTDGNIKNSSSLRDSVVKNISSEDGDTDETSGDDEYKEPWNPLSNYPISLPIRPPGSGDPAILNEQEFGGQVKEYDENDMKSAKELGLLENDGQENDGKTKLIVFKFPEKLPLDKQTRLVPASKKGKEKDESSSSVKEDASNKWSDLKDLPNGHIGKMLVYKSGEVKLKLGDTILNVSPGILGESAQEVAMMNTKSKECCVLGPVDKVASVSVDLDSLDISQL